MRGRARAQCAAQAAGGGVCLSPAAPRSPQTARAPALDHTGKRPAQHRRLWAGPSKCRGQRVAPERRGQRRVPARHSRLRDPPHSPQGCGGVRSPGAGRGGEAGREARRGRAGPDGRLRESSPAHPGLSLPPGSAADGTPSGRGCMGLPRGRLFWPLLLLAAVCSGILVALYSSAVELHLGPRTGAR